MPVKCMLQMPMPIVLAPAKSHASRMAPRVAVTRDASSSATYDARTAMTIERPTSVGAYVPGMCNGDWLASQTMGVWVPTRRGGRHRPRGRWRLHAHRLNDADHVTQPLNGGVAADRQGFDDAPGGLVAASGGGAVSRTRASCVASNESPCRTS